MSLRARSAKQSTTYFQKNPSKTPSYTAQTCPGQWPGVSRASYSAKSTGYGMMQEYSLIFPAL